MLLIASSRNWYSTPWLSPCPEPSRTMSMKIPQATEKPVRNVRSLFFRIVSRISCHLSRSNTRAYLVALDEPVLEAYDPVGSIGDVALVRDDEDRDSRAVNLAQELHDLQRGLGVERAGRLVRQ